MKGTNKEVTSVLDISAEVGLTTALDKIREQTNNDHIQLISVSFSFLFQLICSHNPRSSSYILPQAERHAALSCSSYRSPSLHVADRPLVDLPGLQLTQRSHIGSHRLQIFILCQKVPEAQEKDPTQ